MEENGNMTFKELCFKWDDSDSISEKEELGEQICTLGRTFLNRKLELYKRFKIEKCFGDYLPHRGSIEVYSVKTIHTTLKYTDWSMGYIYEEYVHIEYKEIDDLNYYDNLENGLRTQRIEILKNSIALREEDIKQYRKEIEELEK